MVSKQIKKWRPTTTKRQETTEEAPCRHNIAYTMGHESVGGRRLQIAPSKNVVEARVDDSTLDLL